MAHLIVILEMCSNKQFLLEEEYSGVGFFSLSYQPQLAVTSVRILRVMDVILITLVLPPQNLAIVT